MARISVQTSTRLRFQLGDNVEMDSIDYDYDFNILLVSVHIIQYNVMLKIESVTNKVAENGLCEGYG